MLADRPRGRPTSRSGCGRSSRPGSRAEHRLGHERGDQRAAHVLRPSRRPGTRGRRRRRTPAPRRRRARAPRALRSRWFSGSSGSAGMVRERPVELREQVDAASTGRRAITGGDDEAAHPVGGVGHDGERPHGADVHERQHVLDVGAQQVALLDPAPSRRPGADAPRLDQRRGPRAARCPRRRASRPARQNFSPLYCFGLWLAVSITPGQVERAAREVEEVGRGEAEVDDVDALRASRPRRTPRRGSGDESRQSRPSRIAGRAGPVGEGRADPPREVRVELVGDDAADVVGLEDAVQVALRSRAASYGVRQDGDRQLLGGATSERRVRSPR